MKSELLLEPHQGTGDMLVINGLARVLARQQQVFVLSRISNIESTRFQWRDNPRIEVVSVQNDHEMHEISNYVERRNFPVLRLGFINQPFLIKIWDVEFYRQACVSFDECWKSFKVVREPIIELPVPLGSYAFVHDDQRRGFCIKPDSLPRRLKHVRPQPSRTRNIYAYWAILEHAQEIHCMESCFAILVDHLPRLKARRLVLHTYTRQSIPPQYARKWEIIR